MPTIPVRELVPVLQAAIGPVIFISGVGLLLLTLSNRFGRAVDRARALSREKRKVIFIGCLLCLIVSLAAFIREIRLLLQALRLELGLDVTADPDLPHG